MLILGESNIGKTCLQQRYINKILYKLFFLVILKIILILILFLEVVMFLEVLSYLMEILYLYAFLIILVKNALEQLENLHLRKLIVFY